MEYLLAIALIPWLLVLVKAVRARPEWAVVIGLIPSLFLAEDLHENYFVDPSAIIVTFHSIKIAGFLRPTEVIMIVLTLVLLSVWRGKRESLSTPFDKTILILIILCPVSAMLSIFRGADPVNALGYNVWRTFWWSLLFFYFCVFAIKRERVEKCFALFYYCLIARIGFGVAKFFGGFGETHPHYANTAIVFWDGLDLHLASCLFVMSALLLLDKRVFLRRGWLLLGLFLSTFTIMYSLRRTPIANVVLAVAVTFGVFPMRYAGRFFAGLAAIFLVGLLTLLFATGEGSRAGTDVIISRLGEIFTLDMESIDEFHFFDPIDHLIAISEKPIIGLGFGVPFKRTFLIREGESTFSHNAYLFVWGGMGIIGLLLYLALYYKIIAFARKLFVASGNVMLIPALLSVILTGLAQGIYSTGHFTSSRMPFVLAFVTALLVRYQDKAQNDHGLGHARHESQ